MKNIINKSQSIIPDARITELANNIAIVVNEAKNKITHTINVSLVEAYWNIGRYIVEFEQCGNIKAEYGSAMLSKLSDIVRQIKLVTYNEHNLYVSKYELYLPNKEELKKRQIIL